MMCLNTDSYECVISNLALQWLDSLADALKLLHSKSSALFAFSTLLDKTFAEWGSVINQYQSIQMLSYPSAEEIVCLCNKIKKPNQVFHFWLRDETLLFDNPLLFMRYLKHLGASSANKAMHLGNLKKLLKTATKSLSITYKIFFGIFKQI